jgi:ABC-type polysaccharide/polyol phosphate transport system ATPase subunit
MSSISVKDLSIKFRIYHDTSPSLKDMIASFFNSKKKTGYSDFFAVKNVSFEIKQGDRVGIIGHNGAGKSTLLKALCRIYEPSTGGILVDGRVAPLLEIGAGFHPEFTGRENIYLNGSILGYTKQQLRVLEPEIIKFAELEEFIDTSVKYYSTGMYLRLAFSVATAVQPEILILDEMFAGGDANFIKKATDRMKQVVDQAKIMVLVSHDTSLLRMFCNRVIWIDHGQIKADGDSDVVIDSYIQSQKI